MAKKILKKAQVGVQQMSSKNRDRVIKDYKKANNDIKNNIKNNIKTNVIKSITNKAYTDSMNKVTPAFSVNPSTGGMDKQIKKRGGAVKTKTKTKK